MIWDAESLWQRIEPMLPGFTIEVVPRCGSTNTVLLERARAGQLEPTLLVAEQQLAGRGRQGRAWHSEPGAALLMSLALPLAPRAPSGWQGLSLAVGVALAEALEPQGLRIGLKWPNDLWLRETGDTTPGLGRKLAGILIETVAIGEQRVAVIGVGINLQPLAADEARFASGHASLSELDPDVSPPRALATVLQPLVQALREFESSGLQGFTQRFARRDLLRGAAVATQGAEVCVGEAAGITSDGALRVRLASGAMQALASGEISVRVQAVPGAGQSSPPAGGVGDATLGGGRGRGGPP